MARYTVGLAESCFEVHALSCPDPARKTPSRGRPFAGYNDEPWTVEAEDGAHALDATLREDFSGAGEHPARDGYTEGSYGAAGFTGRVFPCCNPKGGR
jgi:hypothetical protein